MLLGSCNQESQQGELMQLSIEEGSVGNKLIDYAEDVSLIPLQYTGDNSLISSIRKLEVKNDTIFILNALPGGEGFTFMLFGKNGDFLKNINTISSDALISSRIKDFLIREDGRIYIVDQNDNIIALDKNLAYLNHEVLPLLVNQIFPLQEEGLLIYTNGLAKNFQSDSLMYKLLSFDSNKSVSMAFQPFQIEAFTEQVQGQMYGAIQENSKGYLYSEFLNDTLYQVGIDTVYAKYHVNFGELAYNKLDFPRAKVVPFSPILTDNYKWGITVPIEFEGNLFFAYMDRNTPTFSIYQKSKAQLLNFAIKDIMGDENVIPMPRHYDGMHIYGYFTEADLSGVSEIETYAESSIIKRAYDHMSVNYNPVIVKYKINLP
jgi:hypothetical protein